MFGGVAQAYLYFPDLYTVLDSEISHLVLAECISVDKTPKLGDFCIFDVDINGKQLILAQSKIPHPDLLIRYKLGEKYLLLVDEGRYYPTGFAAITYMVKEGNVYIYEKWEIFSVQTKEKYLINFEWVPLEDIFYTRERRRDIKSQDLKEKVE